MRTHRKGRLSLLEYAAYGAGGLFVNLAIIGDQFGLYFLTNVAMMPAATVGAILMFTTFFDAINDPVIGGLADRCNTRIGKYRPFIIAGGLLMCVSMIFRFTVPNLGDTGKIIYYSALLVLFSIGFTGCCVPWQAMMAVLAKDYDDRNILLTVRLVSGALVGTLIGAVILDAVEHLGGGAAGWQRFVMLAWCLGIPCILFCQYGMRRVDYAGSIPDPPEKGFFLQMLHLAQNKPVVCVCAAIGLSSLTQTIGNVSAMYYYEYVLLDTSVLAKTTLYSFPLSLGCTLLLPLILKKIDKRHLLVIAYGINLVKPVAIFLFGASLSVNAAIALIVFSHIGAAFYGSSIYAWIPECVDWTNWRHGAGAAGAISASVTFMQKVGRALGQWMAGGLMGAAGFHAAAEITPRITGMILSINGLFQVVGFSLTLIPILLFPISRAKGDEIRKALADRDKARD